MAASISVVSIFPTLLSFSEYDTIPPIATATAASPAANGPSDIPSPPNMAEIAARPFTAAAYPATATVPAANTPVAALTPATTSGFFCAKFVIAVKASVAAADSFSSAGANVAPSAFFAAVAAPSSLCSWSSSSPSDCNVVALMI